MITTIKSKKIYLYSLEIFNFNLDIVCYYIKVSFIENFSYIHDKTLHFDGKIRLYVTRKDGIGI